MFLWSIDIIVYSYILVIFLAVYFEIQRNILWIYHLSILVQMDIWVFSNFCLLQINLNILVRISHEYSCACPLGTYGCISLKHIWEHWICICSSWEDEFLKVDVQCPQKSMSSRCFTSSPTLGIVRILVFVNSDGCRVTFYCDLKLQFPDC